MAPRITFRRLDGILLLDKPGGMSSNAALQIARRLYRAEKGGHTGSLDPLATGLLPLCFGEATKIAGLLLGSAKEAELCETIAADQNRHPDNRADGRNVKHSRHPEFRNQTFDYGCEKN